MKRMLLGCFLFLMALSTLNAQEDDLTAFSMEEAIGYAEKHSMDVRQSQLDVAYAKAQVQEYTAIGIPKLNAKLEYQYFIDIPTQLIPDFVSPALIGTLKGFQLIPESVPDPETTYSEAQFGTNNNLTGSITMSTLVFDGSYFVGLKAAKGLKEMTKRRADLTKQDLKYNIISSYQTVLIAQENKDILIKNIDNLKKTLSETQAFYESGLVEQLDVDRLSLSVANLESELDIVDRQVELAYNVLKFQMGYPMDQSIMLKDSLVGMLEEATSDDLEGEIATFYANRIELDILKRTEYLNELNVKRIKSGYLPNLTAFASHQQVLQRNDLFDNDEAGFNPMTVVGITLNVPIFDGMDKSAKLQMAKIDKERYSLQIENFKRSMDLQITNARATYINAQKRLENQQKNLELAERILNLTKTKYREGVGSSLEMTQAEQELYRTQSNYLNALYDLVVAKRGLDQALGK